MGVRFVFRENIDDKVHLFVDCVQVCFIDCNVRSFSLCCCLDGSSFEVRCFGTGFLDVSCIGGGLSFGFFDQVFNDCGDVIFDYLLEAAFIPQVSAGFSGSLDDIVIVCFIGVAGGGSRGGRVVSS